ncbi:MAG TPA: DUF4468 domain-containing protein [Cyclobacteriaceae bacterium]|nr:DUF4468 domain-containing protein [Cyclobacteriaceae bacterium]
MKNLLLPILAVTFLLCSCATGKIVNMEDDPYVEYFGELEAPQDQLFVSTNKWMIKVFKDARNIIQYSDKEQGVIMGKYLLSEDVFFQGNLIGPVLNIQINAIIDIRLRDNNARFSITPLGNWVESSYQGYSKERANEDMEMLADNFYTFLLKDLEEYY